MSRDQASSTLMQCERCEGKGARRQTVEHGTSYSVHGETECWLCRGSGMVTPVRLRSWERAGRPIEKPDDWIV